jgi:hypothetical protein
MFNKGATAALSDVLLLFSPFEVDVISQPHSAQWFGYYAIGDPGPCPSARSLGVQPQSFISASTVYRACSKCSGTEHVLWARFRVLGTL